MENSAAGTAPERTASPLALWAWAAALFALTAWLGRLDLLDPDEARHAEVAREMLAAGRWLTPVLHGEPYYDKPAAFYWMLATSMRALGENAFAARLPCVVAAIWTLIVTQRFARKAYSPTVAALAVAGLATTLSFAVLGRTVLVDMPFTAAVTTALARLAAWRLDAPDHRRSIWPFYAAVGLGCVLKGPAALALGGLAAIGMAATSATPVATIRALMPLRGTLVVLAIALPWYLAAWTADPAYITDFVLRHNVERYLRPIGAGHVEPWYYYAIALPGVLLPWTPMVAVAAATRLRPASRNAADVVCAVWAGAVLLFFLPASTKLATYLLPALPPLACLTAAWAATLPSAASSARRWIAPYAAAWTLLVAVAGLGASVFVVLHHQRPVASALLGAVPLAVFVAVVRRRNDNAATTGFLAGIAFSSLALSAVAFGSVADAVNGLKDARAGASIVRRSAGDTGDFVAYRCIPHAVAFYAGKSAVRTRDVERALAALAPARPGALLTERKRLKELGLDPPPPGVERAWENGSNLVLLVRSNAARENGGEGRESNPPPTFEAGVTVLKTGRTTGPDPSPLRSRVSLAHRVVARTRFDRPTSRHKRAPQILEPR